MQYLYTDRLYIGMDQIDDCIRLAQQCKLEDLKAQLQMRINSIEMFGRPLVFGVARKKILILICASAAMFPCSSKVLSRAPD